MAENPMQLSRLNPKSSLGTIDTILGGGYHGKLCAVAPIADAPGKTVDEDLARAAAGEIRAVIAVIQINLEPETCVIAVPHS